MNSFNPINHPICFEIPDRLTLASAWVEHIPFGMYITDILRPNLLVELGTHRGHSYCAFCQAVVSLNLSTKCFAVDTWLGDEHAGFYGDEVFLELRDYHDPLYGHFSQLLRSTFDDAAQNFSDSSIDLLHIDGLHTYTAVKHDFETWLPKVSSKGVVLFHDTNVREGDFGVWKFWEEVKSQFPSFEFFHGHGLGLLAVGEQINPDLVNFLEPESAAIIRKFFSSLGKKYDLYLSLLSQSAQLIQMERINQNSLSTLAERDQTITNLQLEFTNQLAERDQTIVNLQLNFTNTLTERDKTITDLYNEQSNLEQKNQALVTSSEEQSQLVGKLRDELTISQHEIVEYVQSTSWKITRPFRKIKKLFLRN